MDHPTAPNKAKLQEVRREAFSRMWEYAKQSKWNSLSNSESDLWRFWKCRDEGKMKSALLSLSSAVENFSSVVHDKTMENAWGIFVECDPYHTYPIDRSFLDSECEKTIEQEEGSAYWFYLVEVGETSKFRIGWKYDKMDKETVRNLPIAFSSTLLEGEVIRAIVLIVHPFCLFEKVSSDITIYKAAPFGTKLDTDSKTSNSRFTAMEIPLPTESWIEWEEVVKLVSICHE